MIREMCWRCFAGQSAKEVEVRAVELAQEHVEEEVAIFEHEDEVAQEAMEAVMEEVTAVTAVRELTTLWAFPLHANERILA
jgi:hypothetical protein